MLKSIFRRKKKEEAEVQEGYETPGLALLDNLQNPVMTFPPSVVENLRHMVTRMAQKENIPAKLALVSTLSGEGVTFNTYALAVTIANDMAVSVCVVDLNWWDTSEHIFPARNGGLAAAIAGASTVEEIIVRTGQPNLAVVPAGRVGLVDRPIVARSAGLSEVIDELSNQFDHLILDVPAVLSTSDAIALSGLADACCVVVKQGATSIENVRLGIDDLSHLKILGVILNEMQTSTPEFLLKFIPQS